MCVCVCGGRGCGPLASPLNSNFVPSYIEDVKLDQ